jgi:hypothetical protein
MNPNENTMTLEEREAIAMAKLEEMEIKLDAFRHEAVMRVESIREGIEETNHHLNVAKHQIQEDMTHGVRKIIQAQKDIVFPEDAF